MTKRSGAAVAAVVVTALNKKPKIVDSVVALNTTMPTSYDFPPISSDCLKIVTFNVNSLNAAASKGALDYLRAENADIVCLQETKISSTTKPHPSLANFLTDYPHVFFHNCGTKKGYSGSAVFSKLKPLNVFYGFNATSGSSSLKPPEKNAADNANEVNENRVKKLDDDEGRVICVELEDFYLVTSYVPNAGQDLKRLDWKTKSWAQSIEAHFEV